MFKEGDYVYTKANDRMGIVCDIDNSSPTMPQYLVKFEQDNGVSQGWYKECDIYSVLADSKVEYVNHPKHYSDGKYECIEVMRDVFGDDAVKTFCMLNAFKYTWRAGKKNGKEDIKKATWYLDYASKL